MQCPRCEEITVELMVGSPVGGEWEMYLCGTCYYSWRSTECAELTDPSKYHPRFKLAKDKIAELTVHPPIPALREKTEKQK